MKHTPGPWEVIRLNEPYVAIGKQLPDTINGFGTYNVYLTQPIQNNSHYICHDELKADEILANARLMAAAPEMLEALEIAKQMLIELNAYKDVGINSPCQVMTNKIDAAIAKAKGETQ